MHTFLIALSIISSILIIIVVMLQESKSGGLSGLTGGAEELFGKQKVRGVELVLQRITVVLAFIFFVSLLCLTWFNI
ncbi:MULTISPECIES: preprotein translocase subunit SecG [unclassified Gemella]|uniref:preprotein translocase subunit SecG n=1 Tax=unclassified Gemella TaxID=2624949 RepID=UPI001C04E9E5|nr:MULTISPECIES: preprotein translocase subunit SecG [unclassified Gemella]MBU0278908.1 preprotein translocase subunit SecG [Gemella sp. zg-1178]QWQ38464.1 preprotein translocase subunit SecG [Gemella sp. zg-570]